MNKKNNKKHPIAGVINRGRVFGWIFRKMTGRKKYYYSIDWDNQLLTLDKINYSLSEALSIYLTKTWGYHRPYEVGQISILFPDFELKMVYIGAYKEMKTTAREIESKLKKDLFDMG
jgi:hypothetical protein